MAIPRLVKAVGWAVQWPVTSQEVSRRNAMLAATALTQRRAERLEVEEFFARYVEQSRPDRTLPRRVG
jgi:hypothetical protein